MRAIVEIHSSFMRGVQYTMVLDVALTAGGALRRLIAMNEQQTTLMGKMELLCSFSNKVKEENEKACKESTRLHKSKNSKAAFNQAWGRAKALQDVILLIGNEMTNQLEGLALKTAKD